MQTTTTSTTADEKMRLAAAYPGMAVELDPDEAELLGASLDDSMSEAEIVAGGVPSLEQWDADIEARFGIEDGEHESSRA
jgi:hypothetical protein